MNYAKSVRLDLPYAAAVTKVKEAFQAKGFGALTEIDVKATLEQKLGVEVEPYLIIGACNPNLAHQALEAEPRIGLLLPCNVVVRRAGAGVLIDALDPQLMAEVTGAPGLQPIADEAARLIDEALAELVEQDGPR